VWLTLERYSQAGKRLFCTREAFWRGTIACGEPRRKTPLMRANEVDWSADAGAVLGLLLLIAARHFLTGKAHP
jgi:hypothetical protein